MVYYAITVGCNKVEPEIILSSQSLALLKRTLSVRLGLEIDTLQADFEADENENWACPLDYEGEHWAYNIPCNLLDKVFRDADCTCFGCIYVVKVEEDLTDMRKLMDVIHGVVV